MASDDIRKHGSVTDYHPEKDAGPGARDKSVSGAKGTEGSEKASSSGAASGGAAGRTGKTTDGDR